MKVIRAALILATVVVCYHLVFGIVDLTKSVDSGEQSTEQKDSDLDKDSQ